MPITVSHGPSFAGTGRLALATGRGRFNQFLAGLEQERERIRVAREELAQRARMQERGIRSDEFQQGRSLADQASAREFSALLSDRELTRRLEDAAQARQFGFLADDFLQTSRFGESARDRDFQARQAALTRDFSAGESALDRSFRGGESALDRQQQTDLQGRSLATGLASDAARLGAADRQQVRGLTAEEILQQARIAEAQRSQGAEFDFRGDQAGLDREEAERRQVSEILSRYFFQLEEQDFRGGLQDESLAFQEASQRFGEAADFQELAAQLRSAEQRAALSEHGAFARAQLGEQGAFARARLGAQSNYARAYLGEQGANYRQGVQTSASLAGAQMTLANNRLEQGWQYSDTQQQMLSRLEQENARIMDAVMTGQITERDARGAIDRNNLRRSTIVPDTNPGAGKFPTGHAIGEIFFDERLPSVPLIHKPDGTVMQLPGFSPADGGRGSLNGVQRAQLASELVESFPALLDRPDLLPQYMQAFESGDLGFLNGAAPTPRAGTPQAQSQAAQTAAQPVRQRVAQLTSHLQQLQANPLPDHLLNIRAQHALSTLRDAALAYGADPNAMPPDVQQEVANAEILLRDANQTGGPGDTYQQQLDSLTTPRRSWIDEGLDDVRRRGGAHWAP